MTGWGGAGLTNPEVTSEAYETIKVTALYDLDLQQYWENHRKGTIWVCLAFFAAVGALVDVMHHMLISHSLSVRFSLKAVWSCLL